MHSICDIRTMSIDVGQTILAGSGSRKPVAFDRWTALSQWIWEMMFQVSGNCSQTLKKPKKMLSIRMRHTRAILVTTGSPHHTRAPFLIRTLKWTLHSVRMELARGVCCMASIPLAWTNYTMVNCRPHLLYPLNFLRIL